MNRNREKGMAYALGRLLGTAASGFAWGAGFAAGMWLFLTIAGVLS